MLTAASISYSVEGDEGPHLILDDVDIDADCGEIVDVVGPSGSGKTTLLRALARLLPDVKGALALDGAASAEIEPQEWRQRVTLLPQITALVPGTVANNIQLPWSLKVRHGFAPPTAERMREALDDMGLEEVNLERSAAKLSVGQAARVALLRTILTEPDVLLLDEPDANLDDESAAQVTSMTRDFAARGGAVVRVRHLRADELATRRLRLECGHPE